MIADPAFHFFDRDALVARARSSRAGYAAARPFPHAVFDDFLPQTTFERVADGFPSPSHEGWKRKDYVEQAARLGSLERRGFRGVAPAA